MSVGQNLPFECSIVRPLQEQTLHKLERMCKQKGQSNWEAEMTELGKLVMKNIGVSYMEDETDLDDMIDE